MSTATPTMELRFQLRWESNARGGVEEVPVLQQRWDLHTKEDGRPAFYEEEWRDIPTVKE